VQTQGAIGNLINRYRAVLKKCCLLNVFGSLAVAGLLVMGGVAGAEAAQSLDFSTTAEDTIVVDYESMMATSSLSESGDAANGYKNTNVSKVTVIEGGQLEVLGGSRIVHRSGPEAGTGMDVEVTGGSIDIGGIGSAMEVNTLTISAGEISIGNLNPDDPDATVADNVTSLGAYKGFTMTGGTVNLNKGGLLFGYEGTGTQILGGIVNMSDNSTLRFSKREDGHDTIGAGATINVHGNSSFDLGAEQAVLNQGIVNVQPGATLTLKAGIDSVTGSPLIDPSIGGQPEFTTQTGGTLNIQGDVLLQENSHVRIDGGTVNITGDGRILGTPGSGSDGGFSMAGGTLNIDATTTSGDVSIAVKVAKITGGEVNISGAGYLGSYAGLTIKGGTVNLNDGAYIFDYSDAGTQLIGGTINMGQNSYITFSQGSTGSVLAEGANITVKGAGARLELSTAGLETAGNISVEEGAGLTIAGQTATTFAARSVSGSRINQTGGVISTAGPLTLTGNTHLTVNNGATLQTIGNGYVQTEDGSTVTVAGTLDASAVSAKTNADGTGGGAIRGAGSATLESGSTIRISNAKAGETYRLLAMDTPSNGIIEEGVTIESTSSSLDMVYNSATGSFDAIAQSVSDTLPNLDGGLASLVDNMTNSAGGAELDSPQVGRRFLARAIDDLRGGSSDSQTATVESAARIAAVSAVPQMTWAAQNAGVNAISQRTSLAAPASAGLQAVAADGNVQTGVAAGDTMKNGFAMWIMPLYQSWNAWGLEGGNLDMDVHGGLGGLAVGADYTFDHAFRAGITVNMGGGYAEGSGDFNKTTNDFTFWGLGAYLGWSQNNFGLTADINHTWVYNDVEQNLPATMQMDNLKSDITSRALSAGLRGEYKLETDALDITPHVGVRYTYLTTDKYDVESNGTVMEGDAIHQGIWTFPVGVAFSKDVQMENGWYVKPSLDLSVVPAAGDIKARGDVRFTGVNGSAELSTQTMDYITYMGQVGLEFGNDTVKLGVNYNLQMGAQSTAHGVFGTLRYEF